MAISGMAVIIFEKKRKIVVRSGILLRTVNTINGKLACFTAQKMKFPMKNFFSKCDQIRCFLRIWSQLPKKSFNANLIF